MNRKVCVLCILLFVCLFMENLHNKETVMSLYSIVGILSLSLFLLVDVKRGEYLKGEKKERSYVNFAFLYFILGGQIENLITYINKQSDVLIIGFFIEGVIGFAILAICEFIRFMFPSLIKSRLKWLYCLIVGMEVTKIIILFVRYWMK